MRAANIANMFTPNCPPHVHRMRRSALRRLHSFEPPTARSGSTDPTGFWLGIQRALKRVSSWKRIRRKLTGLAPGCRSGTERRPGWWSVSLTPSGGYPNMMTLHHCSAALQQPRSMCQSVSRYQPSSRAQYQPGYHSLGGHRGTPSSSAGSMQCCNGTQQVVASSGRDASAGLLLPELRFSV
jgi:hypothetical protein